MEENEVVEMLSALVCGRSDDAENFTSEVRSVRTYREAGILSRNEGLVIQMSDGRQFQITVIQSI